MEYNRVVAALFDGNKDGYGYGDEKSSIRLLIPQTDLRFRFSRNE